MALLYTNPRNAIKPRVPRSAPNLPSREACPSENGAELADAPSFTESDQAFLTKSSKNYPVGTSLAR